jgi:dolichol kinase
LQPWRKLFHAFNGVAIAAGLVYLGPSRNQALVLLGGIAILLLLGDVLRLAHKGTNQLFFRAFSSLASPREAKGLASSTWYVFGIVVALLLAPRPEVVSGVLVLGLADPAASAVGQKYGQKPFLGGTIEGTLVFVAVALAILILRHPWPAALPAAIFAAVAERRSWPIDDNFTIPVVTSLSVYGITLVL